MVTLYSAEAYEEAKLALISRLLADIDTVESAAELAGERRLGRARQVPPSGVRQGRAVQAPQDPPPRGRSRRRPRTASPGRMTSTGGVRAEHAYSGTSWSALTLEVGKSPTEVRWRAQLPTV